MTNLPRGRIKTPVKITGERELTRADLAVLAQPRAKTGRITRLRNSHHRVALLLSYGMPYKEIADVTGYSYARVATLAIDPAIMDLSARMRADQPEAHVTEVDEYTRLKLRNMIAAERHISDTIEELDEEGELLPIKTALAVSADGADRLGYSKHTTQTNVNYELGSRLEKAIARSGITIEGRPSQERLSIGGPVTSPGASPVLLPFRRRL